MGRGKRELDDLVSITNTFEQNAITAAMNSVIVPMIGMVVRLSHDVFARISDNLMNMWRLIIL